MVQASTQCESIEIAPKSIEIGAILSVGRQIESKEVKCCRDILDELIS